MLTSNRLPTGQPEVYGLSFAAGETVIVTNSTSQEFIDMAGAAIDYTYLARLPSGVYRLHVQGDPTAGAPTLPPRLRLWRRHSWSKGPMFTATYGWALVCRAAASAAAGPYTLTGEIATIDGAVDIEAAPGTITAQANSTCYETLLYVWPGDDQDAFLLEAENGDWTGTLEMWPFDHLTAGGRAQVVQGVVMGALAGSAGGFQTVVGP